MTGDLAIGGSPYPRVGRKATKAATSPPRSLPEVKVEGSDVVLRVAAPVTLAAGFRQGESVRLAVAPSACVPLAEEGK